MTEPWISGSHSDVDPLLRPLFHAFDHARLDLAKWTDGLTTDDIWSTPEGVGPIGFHIRHIAGSAERLFTYVQGGQLSAEQLAALKSEAAPGASLDELLRHVDRVFASVLAGVRAIPLDQLREPRAVGRKQLPTTVNGLLVHIAEHTVRHVGEIIVISRLIQAKRTAFAPETFLP
jgi:uncharacterized damage-inducible protein DinB